MSWRLMSGFSVWRKMLLSWLNSWPTPAIVDSQWFANRSQIRQRCSWEQLQGKTPLHSSWKINGPSGQDWKQKMKTVIPNCLEKLCLFFVQCCMDRFLYTFLCITLHCSIRNRQKPRVLKDLQQYCRRACVVKLIVKLKQIQLTERTTTKKITSKPSFVYSYSSSPLSW